jgi:hypothetical protein
MIYVVQYTLQTNLFILWFANIASCPTTAEDPLVPLFLAYFPYFEEKKIG